MLKTNSMYSILNNFFAAPRAFTATTGLSLKASVAAFAMINIFLYSSFHRRTLLRRNLFANIASSFLISSIFLIIVSYVFYDH